MGSVDDQDGNTTAEWLKVPGGSLEASRDWRGEAASEPSAVPRSLWATDPSRLSLSLRSSVAGLPT